MSDNATIRVLKPHEQQPKPQPMDDDLRRLVISLGRLLQRRFPDDFRRIMREMDRAKA